MPRCTDFSKMSDVQKLDWLKEILSLGNLAVVILCGSSKTSATISSDERRMNCLNTKNAKTARPASEITWNRSVVTMPGSKETACERGHHLILCHVSLHEFYWHVCTLCCSELKLHWSENANVTTTNAQTVCINFLYFMCMKNCANGRCEWRVCGADLI